MVTLAAVKRKGDHERRTLGLEHIGRIHLSTSQSLLLLPPFQNRHKKRKKARSLLDFFFYFPNDVNSSEKAIHGERLEHETLGSV
jgi:hypothetical protein